MNDPIAACSCDSESTRKLAELTMRSPGLQTRQDHDVIVYPRADLDLTGFEIAVAVIDKSDLPRARMQRRRKQE